MANFVMRTKVMFQHCDPAGIVFYPRYFEMVNQVVETFFDEAVDWSFARMHHEDRMGVPMGRIATEFHAVSRLGDMLDWSLAVARIGRSSLDLRIEAQGGGDPRISVDGTVICARLDTVRAVPWTDPVREIFKTYMEDGA